MNKEEAFEKWNEQHQDCWVHEGFDAGWDAGIGAERERIIQLILDGSFLHDQAPTAQWAREVVTAIRRSAK